MVEFDINTGELDVETVSPWLLRIELYKQEVLVKNIEMDSIKNRIKEELDEDLVVLASEINADNLVLRIRCKRDVGAEKVLGDDDEDDDEFDDIPDDNSPDRFLAKVEEYLLKNLNIVGVKGISKAYYRHDKTNKEWDSENGFKKDEEWILSTDGTNLIETLNDDNVDHARTVSNDIPEIFKVLGIEAVRRALVNEIRGTIAASGGGYINYRHLSILVDSMTIRGYVMPITRHGLLSTNYGDLMKSSYEQTVEVLLKASALARVDRLKGPTQNIMLGQTCGIGTGDMDCILDEEMLSNIVRTGTDMMSDTQIGISAVPMTPGDMPTPMALNADNLDQIMTSPVAAGGDDDMEFSPIDSPYSQTPVVGVQSPGISTFGGSITSPGYDGSATPLQSPYNTPGYTSGGQMGGVSPGYDNSIGGESPYVVLVFECEAREPFSHPSLTHSTHEFEYDNFTRTPMPIVSLAHGISLRRTLEHLTRTPTQVHADKSGIRHHRLGSVSTLQSLGKHQQWQPELSIDYVRQFICTVLSNESSIFSCGSRQRFDDVEFETAGFHVQSDVTRTVWYEWYRHDTYWKCRDIFPRLLAAEWQLLSNESSICSEW